MPDLTNQLDAVDSVEGAMTAGPWRSDSWGLADMDEGNRKGIALARNSLRAYNEVARMPDGWKLDGGLWVKAND